MLRISSTVCTETTAWRTAAFADAAIKLARLCAGDVLAIGTYEKDGQTPVSLSILATSILPLCAPKKAKAQSGAKFSGMPEKPAQPGANAPPALPIQPEFDDACPENMGGTRR